MAPVGDQEEQPSLQQVEMEEVEDGETVGGLWAFIVGEVTTLQQNHGED